MTETNDGTKSNYTQNYYDARGNVLRVYTGLSAPLTINGLDNVVLNGDGATWGRTFFGTIFLTTK